VTYQTLELQTQEVAKAYGAVCTPEFFLYKKVYCVTALLNSRMKNVLELY
jgi:hypothetical protein